MLAFVILIAFQTYNSAKDGASQEAVALVELARSAQFYPFAQRERLRGQLACYARAVAYDEWPLLDRHSESPTSVCKNGSPCASGGPTGREGVAGGCLDGGGQ